MFYPESKIYHDGSHYIAIPHSTIPTRRRPREKEELVSVLDEGQDASVKYLSLAQDEAEADVLQETNECESINTNNEKEGGSTRNQEKTKTESKATRSELFNAFYLESLELPKRGRQGFIVKKMRPYFESVEQARAYVRKKIEDKTKSLIARRTRFVRKAYMNDFNYFATFTYDDKLQTEQSFKRKLLSCLSTFQKRKSWRYMGVWERGAKTGRLHFHGLLQIPDGSMPGELIEKRDYSLTSHNVQLTYQNTYFNSRFGRTDMKELCGNPEILRETIVYVLKYLEKTGERIVYSHGLPMYVISDIDEKDVIMRFGLEDKKLLLFDDFICWDEGEYIGQMCGEIKKRLRGTN